MRKKKRAILVPLDELKHSLQDEMRELVKISLHLRSYHESRNIDTIFRVVEEIEDFNLKNLGRILAKVNRIIEEA